MRLYITDEGDPLMGICPKTYMIETPFENIGDSDEMEWFKTQMKRVYNEFAEGRLNLEYEYETRVPNDLLIYVK